MTARSDAVPLTKPCFVCNFTGNKQLTVFSPTQPLDSVSTYFLEDGRLRHEGGAKS